MSVATSVGQNLRRRREARGLSLSDLAGAAGIGRSTVHALELGEANPTLSTLWALASALGVPLGDLLEHRPAAVAVVRAHEGARIHGSSVHARLLHALDVHGRVEVYDLDIERAEQDAKAHLPGVQECLVVTHGRVRTGPREASVELAPGDSILHEAAQPHVYEGLDGMNRALLLMIYP